MGSDENGGNPEAELIETGVRFETNADGKVTEHREAEVRLFSPRWIKAVRSRFLKKSENDQDPN